VKNIILIGSIIVNLVFGYFIFSTIHLNQWYNDFKVYKIDSGYLSFRELGGKYNKSLYECLSMDKYRDKTFKYKNKNEILSKYPDLKSYQNYPKNSYRNSAGNDYINSRRGITDILWFDDNDNHSASGWAFVIINEYVLDLILIKG
jgi:hypothetical protein